MGFGDLIWPLRPSGHPPKVWRDYHKHAFARRCYADPSDMGLKALQLSGKRREQDQAEREQLQLQHTLLTRLHHSWRRGIG